MKRMPRIRIPDIYGATIARAYGLGKEAFYGQTEVDSAGRAMLDP
jgi:hypothetical protein